MRRLAALALTLSLVPLAPAASAGAPTVTAWVAERVSPTATTLTVRGGAGARDGEYAFAAVASATAGRDGRFTDADGGLFFGIAPDSEGRVSTPAGDTGCRDVGAGGTACVVTDAGGAIGFAMWWDDVTFNRALIVLRGRNKQVDLGEQGSPGWRLRRWTGAVRVVSDADMASASTALGRGVGTFGYAEAPGGSTGSVAIGRLPCLNAGYTNVGAGAARLFGGTKEKVATCADWYPPAAAAPGGTEWVLDGAATGVSDTPARLVVVENPLR